MVSPTRELMSGSPRRNRTNIRPENKPDMQNKTRMNKPMLLLLLSVFMLTYAKAQQDVKRNFKIVSYNVENYFDTDDNPNTNDEEYLPGGHRGWNNTKYTHKQLAIAKTIAAIGGWEAPDIVGLCEIESDKAMLDLTQNSPLKTFGYKYIQYESPDARGVDVVLMYQPHRFKPFYSEAVHITAFRTRDLLYVAGVTTISNDTLHLFVCHFPSRLGGELQSEVRRVNVASTLRAKVDSVFNHYHKPNIIIMGDFNDYPSNNSMTQVLKATHPADKPAPLQLYNLAFPLHSKGVGSHKFQGEWGMLDQIIVSGSLLNPTNSIRAEANDFSVFEADFLLENDEEFFGKRPFRTYNGMRYLGGYADHLPVILDLWY